MKIERKVFGMAEKCETVKWKGTAGIEQAHRLQNELLEAFKKNSEIRLDISGVDDIDITGIQIVVAARKEAEKSEKSFFITGEIPKAIKEFVAASSITLDEYVLADGESEAANA